MAQSADADNPPETTQITLGDTALYIFTSGTTGLPKAAVLSNRRYLLSAMLSKSGGIRCNEHDVIYICLPLYHGTGLFLGAGAAFCSGACMFIRRKFSASRFLSEVREHGATCFIYIGELCRYLMAVPSQPDDHRSGVENIIPDALSRVSIHRFCSSNVSCARVTFVRSGGLRMTQSATTTGKLSSFSADWLRG